MTKKKVKRKLKKWVKISIFLLIVFLFGLIIVSFKNISFINNKKEKKNNNKVIDKDLKSDKKEEGNNLNRFVYKDGFYYEDLSSSIIDRITGVTFPKEFNDDYSSIAYEDLKYLIVKYYDFEGKEHNNGEMIVHKLVAQEVLEIFYELYENKYPIEKMVLVDNYNGDDELSMQDNNTSCFNYRIVENIDRLAWHAFGLAIDINPLYNPYVVDGNIYPSTASQYVDREKDFRGKIDHDDLAYKLFIQRGWKWGGDFNYSKDYQHFYKEVLDESIRERKN